MRNLWCKLWNVFLNAFTDAVKAVAYALDTVGTVAVELLSSAADAVGGAIGSIFGGGNFLIWAGVGLFAYLLLTNQDEEDKSPSLLSSYRGGETSG